MDLQRLFVQPALLSGVLIYDDEQSHLWLYPLSLLRWRSIGKISTENKRKLPIII
jgi:hypothetical protein